MFNPIDLLLFSISTAFTPGPNNLLCLSNTAKVGFKNNYVLLLGMSVGITVVKFICAFLTALVYDFIPQITLFLQIACVLFIAYLIAKLWIPKKATANSEQEFNGNGFFVGIFMQSVNAKLWLGSIVASSTYILPYFTSPGPIALWTLVQCIFPVIAFHLWSLCGQVFKKFFESHQVLLNVILTALFVYLIVGVFI